MSTDTIDSKNEELFIQAGIPSVENYLNVLKSRLFLNMERFSNGFIENYGDFLKNYKKKWVVDPLHQWSRQYEYPFVLSSILSYSKDRDQTTLRILDARDLA